MASHTSDHEIAISPELKDEVQFVEQIHATSDVPDFTPQEEKRLVRKLDLWIIPLMMVTYTLQSYDKGILSSASQFGILEDLDLETVTGYTASGKAITDNHNYSMAGMMFYLGYLVGSYPMMFLAQRFPTTKVMCPAIALWGATLMATAGCRSFSDIMVARFFLGIFESVVAPSFTVMVTFWWTRKEQAFRTGLWYSCAGVAIAVSPLINYCLGQIGGSLAHWKPMFLILGGITFVWSLALYFTLPDDPFTTKGLTEPERRIVLHRLKGNDAGTVHHKFEKAHILEALTDYKFYSSAAIVLLVGIPSGALGTFGTIVIKGFGFDTFDSLALTCPMGVVSTTAVLSVTYISSKVQNTRYILIAICSSISLAGSLMCWCGSQENRALLYAGILLMCFQVACGGMTTSIVASNVAGHTKKSTVTAGAFVGYCVGNVLGPVIFGLSPGPKFNSGFTGSTIALALVIVIAIVTGIALRLENRRRDRSVHTGVHELSQDLTDRENRDFRYIL